MIMQLLVESLELNCKVIPKNRVKKEAKQISLKALIDLQLE